MRRLVPLLFAPASLIAQSQEPISDTQVIEEITIVGVTPLDSAGHALGAAQTASAADIERSNATDFASFANRRLGSAWINETQGNPLQADLNFRGFTASPLLGTPQGLSVYLDGVRLNQPFADVVSWDLIPLDALESATMLPGANPLFGLNSLGGAAVLTSKDGWSAPGSQVGVKLGAWQRRIYDFQSGGNSGEQGWAWYANLHRFEEDGWRDYSPSAANQALVKGSWRDADTELSMLIAAADTDLNGNGLQDIQLLQSRRASVYTHPDSTANRSLLGNLTLRRKLGDGASLAANAWYRNIRTGTFNGDINEDSLAESVYQPSAAERAALIRAGYTGFPTAGESAANTPFPRWRCIANVLLNSEPGEKCNGLANRGRLSQHEAGANAQVDVELPIGAHDNDLTIGVGIVGSRVHFQQSSQYGYLTPDRGIMTAEGPGAFADGTQDSENAFDARVDFGGHTTTWSVYASDSLAVTPALRATVAARYDATQVRNRDALNPGGGSGSLDGDHRFDRIHPALGLDWHVNPAVTLFGNLGQSSRAPSSIELGCADPDSPCRLPNSMAGDPPLKAVVATSGELGVRVRAHSGPTFTASVFRSSNRDDILFIADEQAGFGYFSNFGRTRRQGVELAIDGSAGILVWNVRYTHLDATFRSDESVNGEANSSNDGPAPGFEGTIDITPGDRIPLTPRHVAKAFVEWSLAKSLSFNADWRYVGASTARGNENGEHEPDGLYYLGEGGAGGYGVVDVGLQWRPVRSVDVFVQVDNLLDRDYASASLLGATGFTTSGSFIARPFAGPVIGGERPLRSTTFLAPGAPRSWLVGLRWRFAD